MTGIGIRNTLEEREAPPLRVAPSGAKNCKLSDCLSCDHEMPDPKENIQFLYSKPSSLCAIRPSGGSK